MLSALGRVLTRRTSSFDARLQGVGGYTGRGDIKVAARSDGDIKLNVALRGVAGRKAELFLGGDLIARVKVDNGRAARIVRKQVEAETHSFQEGARIEVRQNGDAILEGVLKSA
ncbi:MAG: hypothetical protein AAGA09_06130 [Pseudomonadota bacterium]